VFVSPTMVMVVEGVLVFMVLMAVWRCVVNWCVRGGRYRLMMVCVCPGFLDGG
jgi:hypothetical protein